MKKDRTKLNKENKKTPEVKLLTKIYEKLIYHEADRNKVTKSSEIFKILRAVTG